MDLTLNTKSRTLSEAKRIPTGILDVSHPELVQWLASRDIKAYRAMQILKWIYECQADSFAEMTNINKGLREQLAQHFTISRLKCVATEKSTDGTVKYLYELKDGNRIESVLIPERNHYTLCISSQVGCAQGCRFCLTARSGFIRNLSVGEITAQVRDIMRQTKGAKRLTNIVFMGMGEPLANYPNVIKAIQVLTDNTYGLRFAHRRVTVSTAGVVPKIIRLGQDAQVNLAVSLNATNNPCRSRLMPINRIYPIEDLLSACRRFPLKKGRRITFEYILIKGINDARDDAIRLTRLLEPKRSKINLILFNAHPGSVFQRPSEQRVVRFEEILRAASFTTIVRHSKGQDISAACGQLNAAYEPVRRSPVNPNAA